MGVIPIINIINRGGAVTMKQIDEYATVLRFITPILIIITGYLLNASIHGVDKKLESIEIHFTNHLQHHQDLEVGYEGRLSVLETKKGAM